MRIIFLLALSCFLFSSNTWAKTLTAPSPPDLTPITLQLMWKHQFEFAGFYAAQEKGFYKDVGLDVSFKEFNFGNDIVDEVVNGSAQYGVNDASLIINRSKGSPVVLLSNIFQHSPMTLITKSDSGITSPAQLIGKKVMLATHELSNASIVAMLSKESVTLDKLQIIEHNFNVQDLINNKVDAMSAYSTNEPAILKHENIDINIIHPINFGIDFYGNNIFTSEAELNNHPQRADDFVAASLKGWQYALDNPDEIIDLILKKYSQKKTKIELQYEANALRRIILPEFIPLGTIDILRMQRIVDTYQELKLLDKNFNLDGFLQKSIQPKKPHKIIFTRDELEWIKQKKELVLGVDPNWRPFEFIDEKNKYSGMAADFITLIGQKTGLKIIVQNNVNWTDVINSAKNRTLDLLPAVMKSTQRSEYLDFLSPHISYPMVIVTRKNSSYISALNDLKGEKVIVIDGYVTEDLIRQNHPTLDLITVHDIDQALTLISNGEGTAFVDNLATITTAISKGGFSNLKISGTTKYAFELSLAVPKGEKILLTILQKSLDDISEAEISAIKNKWIPLNYTKSVDYSIIYKIIAAAIIIILIIALWNRRLAEEIGSRKIAEKNALNSEKRFRMLFEDNKAVQLIIDPITGEIIQANNAAIVFYGYTSPQLNSKNIKDINTLNAQEIEHEMQLANLQQRTHFYFKHRLADGTIRDVEVHSGPIEWGNKKLLYSIIHDVTNEKILQNELSEQTIELKYQATHDALTGLINRREFEHRLSKSIAFCAEKKSCKRAVLALDLDNFKIINDTAGHATGDDVLIKISQLMSTQVRGRDTFARLGGDEFGIILDNCTIEDAATIAQNIIGVVKGYQYTWNESNFHLGVSIGITQFDCNNPSMDGVLNEADAACYEAKHKGRNRYQVYSADDTALSKRTGERWWTNEILNAVTENRFCLYHQTIQPISSSNQHEGNQFEVLLRLHDVSGNLVFPDNFIPAAEKYNLMPQIDQWVIDNVFLWLAFHPVILKELHKCSINLSGQSIADDGLYDFVMQKFKEHGIPPHKICWEITETAAIADFDKAKDFISKMRAYGCSFSLDDFGSGHSSFNYLKHLEVDYIKIDGSFIKDILTSPKDQLIVESIQTISHGFQMQTIAEFVESDSIKDRLIELNIDYAQGYAIHKPSPLK